MDPTPEQVAAAREQLDFIDAWPRESILAAIRTVLAHLDAVTAERDANRHELDQLVQETLLPLQRELAEAHERGRQMAASQCPRVEADNYGHQFCAAERVERELAEARGRIEALSTLLEWNREAMEAFGVTGGPDITDAIQWAQRQKQELAEARAAIKQVDGNVTAWREGTRRAWLDLPAVKKAMEASGASRT